MEKTKDEISNRNVYDTMKQDPEYLLSLLEKHVKVNLIKNTSFNGFVHSIDPITHSVILAVPNKDELQTTLIPGHAIIEISEMPAPENAKPPDRRKSINICSEELLLRKNKLVAWFKKNLLPVTEEGENIVVNSVQVLSPYSVTDIYSENPVVALQIRSIIEKLPKDFEP